MQLKYRLGWDATDGRNGGAQQTVWEILTEMERFKYQVGEEDPGAVSVVLDLAKAFERVSFPVVWPGLRISASQETSCGFFVGISITRDVQFEGCAAEPLTTITAILSGSKWSCLLLRIVLQDALAKSQKSIHL